MPYRHISEDLKLRALYLYDTYQWYPAALAELFGFSERSFYRWLATYRETSSISQSSEVSQGRPRTLTPIMIRDLYHLIQEAPYLYLDEIQDWLLIAHEVGISKSALHSNLEDAGLSLKVMKKTAAERDEVARAAFREYAHNNWMANQLVFVDETSKDERTIYRHYGRALLGERAVLSAPFVRGVRYSMIAALSLNGYIGQRVVEGSIDGDEFYDFIKTEIVSFFIYIFK